MMERSIAPNHDTWNLLIRVAMEGKSEKMVNQEETENHLLKH